MKGKLINDIVELISRYEDRTSQVVGLGLSFSDGNQFEYNGEKCKNITVQGYKWAKVRIDTPISSDKVKLGLGT
jgi:hypothetical protein